MSNVLLEHHLRTLRLPTMLANYRRLLGDHAEPLPYLADPRHSKPPDAKRTA